MAFTIGSIGQEKPHRHTWVEGHAGAYCDVTECDAGTFEYERELAGDGPEPPPGTVWVGQDARTDNDALLVSDEAREALGWC